jgi:ribose transport system permease protein
VALGMCFVIMTGGIDLSVGSVAALGSVVAALLSRPRGWCPALAGGVAAGLAVGVLNGALVARLGIAPFVTTLATRLGASGLALLLADNQTVPSPTKPARRDRPGRWLGFPVPAWIALFAYPRRRGVAAPDGLPGGPCSRSAGRGCDAADGLPGGPRGVPGVCRQRGLAGRGGRAAGRAVRRRPAIEGRRVGAFAIAATVVGGTLLTGGVGSGRRDAGGRAAARADLQHPQFRERARRDQPDRLLAVVIRGLPAGRCRAAARLATARGAPFAAR